MKLVANPINEIDQSDPLDFPIYVMTEGFVPPTEGNYYLVASNGFWLHKDTGIVHGMIKLNGIGILPSFQPKIGMKLPKAPPSIIFQAFMFFRYIYKQHSAESLLAYVYHPEKKAFGFVCPDQVVHGTGIRYDNKTIKIPPEVCLIGTFHSHCGFGSFHSGTDRHDEADFDGIHVTIGNVDRDEFTITSSIAVNNYRQEVDPLTYFEGIHLKSSYVVNKHYALSLTQEQFNALLRQYSKKIKQWATKVSTPAKYVTTFSVGLEPPVQKEKIHVAIPQTIHDPDLNHQFHAGEMFTNLLSEKEKKNES